MIKDERYIKELEDKLIAAKDKYYNSGEQIMSDYEYDRMEEELYRLNPNSVIFNSVGTGVISGDSVNLGVKAFSTDKALSADELSTYFNRIARFPNDEIVLTMKMDGVSLILFYENGYLVDASTRGDGMIGSRCIDRVRSIPSIPSIVSKDFTGQVRGELTISHSNFDRFNELLGSLGEVLQSNSRNSVSGLLNNKSMKSPQQKMALTSFNAFGVYEGKDFDEYGSYDFYTDQLQKALDLGFTPVAIWKISTAKQMREFLTLNYEKLGKDLSNHGTRADGLVLRLNNNSHSRQIGYAAKYINAATAIKFNPEYALVALKEIEWSYGSNEITPVAIFDPVELDGAQISRCSLHSVKNMLDLELFEPGDTFIVTRSGSVIPKANHRNDVKFNY